MSAAVEYWNVLNRFYHSAGAVRAEARGRLLEIALHGRGKIKAMAREVLASHGITVGRRGA